MAQSAKPITTYRLTDHARMEMARRQISEAEVARVLAAPEQTERVHEIRVVYHSWFAHFLRGCQNCGRVSGAEEVDRGRDPIHCQ
jgi:hypothetical protein